MGADGTENNHSRQNIARQHAANFGRNGTKDSSNYHLIQDTESVLVTTTVDLVPPRGDGVDHSGDNVKLEFEHRGFFADQFEVSLFFLLQSVFSPPSLCTARTPWVYCGSGLRLMAWNVPMALFRRPKRVARVTPQLILSLTNRTLCPRFLPPVGASYVLSCVAS